MIRFKSICRARNSDGENGTVDVLSLRFVELFVFFAIVFVARIIGDFTYRSEALLFVFLGAAVLQYNGPWAWRTVGGLRGWNKDRVKSAILWYSSYVDLLAIVTLIYFTGTIESPFLFLLTIPLFLISNTFPWKTTAKYYVGATLLSVGGLGFLEMKGAIPHFTVFVAAPDLYASGNYLAGSLLVIGAFVSLVLFLSSVFQNRVNVSLEKLRQKGRESESKYHELSRLYDISLGINSAMSMETLLKIVAKEVTLLMKQPWAAIVLFNNKQETVESVFVGVNRNKEEKLSRKIRRGGLSEWIWTHNAPIVVSDTQKDKRANCSTFLSKFGIRSLIGFPLATGKQVMGVIYTGDFRVKQFDDGEVRLLTTLCAQLSTAIEKSKLYESLERKIKTLDKQMKALEKTNILKSDFVTHVSHELRTPLTSIKAYVETLCDNVKDPNFTHQGEFLDIISKETDRLIRIVHDILDVSKIEFGQRPLQRSVFNLTDVLDEVVSMIAPALEEKELMLTVAIPESLPNIDADPDLMKQVFINLIGNAIKYSPAGTEISVAAEEKAVDIYISVQDHGIGIPEDEIGNVFDKYFKVRKQKQQSHFEGVGLGLAIVKNIVEQHGGTIGVESKEGVGSKFTFTIPREHCFNDLIGYIAEVVDAKEQLHEMLELIVRMIADLLSTKVVSLMLLDKTRSELFIKMSYGLDEWVVENTRVKVGEGIAGKVAESGVPLLIDDIEKNEVYTCPNNPQYDTVSLLSVPLMVNDVVVGVINVNNKTSGRPFNQDDLSLLISFSERISRALERVRIVEDSRAFLEDTIEAFKRMLETQSKKKVVEALVGLVVKVSRKLGLSEKEVSVVQYVAAVHDIGMTEVSDEILNKTLHLTDAEMQQIREHPQRGAELIRPLEFVESVSNIILYHHERVDGAGYPMGLKGEEIPIGARILAVIDAYQSMTMGRPYKDKKSIEEAAAELVSYANRQFDAEVVEAFLSVLKEEGKLATAQVRDLTMNLRGAVPSKTS